MGEESYPEGYRITTKADLDAQFRSAVRGDIIDAIEVGDALQLMELRLAGRSPAGRTRAPKRFVTINGVSRPETLREKLQREKDELEEAIRSLAAQHSRRDAQLAELDRYPAEDPFKDGDSLKFTKRYPDGREYTYMALRADARWFVTGSRGPQGVEWAKFTEWLGLGVTDVVKIGNSRNSPVKW